MSKNQEPFEEDDIIELVDVVREGNTPSDAEMDDLSLLLDQEEAPDKEEIFLSREDEARAKTSFPFDETAEEELEPGLTEPDALLDPFESPDFDFEAPDEATAAHAADAFPAMSDALPEMPEEVLDEMPEVQPGISEADSDGIPEEDLDLVMAGLEEDAQEETSGPAAPEEALPAVDRERLETVITHAVTEVVERVVRETVADVAERVIKEAIESLKQSLETKPE